MTLIKQSINHSNILELSKLLKIDLNNGPWIAGGSCRKIYENLPINDGDIDLFFNSRMQLNDTLKILLDLNSKIVARTYNALTVKYNNQDIQLICKGYYSSLERVLDSFDLTICCIGSDGENLYYTDKFKESQDTKTFDINSTHGVDSTIFARYQKYISYGFKPITTGHIQRYAELVISSSPRRHISSLDHYGKDFIMDMKDQQKEIELKINPSKHIDELNQRRIMSKLASKPLRYIINDYEMVSWIGYNMLLSDFYVVFGFVSGFGTGFSKTCLDNVGNRLNILNSEGLEKNPKTFDTIKKIMQKMPNLKEDNLEFLELY